MSTFQVDYSRMYDALYAKKDYPREATAVHELLQKFCSTAPQRLLSIGAGTLGHEQLLLPHGYNITCIDSSSEMVRIAQQKISQQELKNITIAEGDMEDLQFVGAEFDAAVSLFNVISYCSNDEALEKVFSGVASALKPNGIFIFDCWNGESVRKDPPHDKFAKFIDGDSKLYRYTRAIPEIEKGVVTIQFDVLHTQGSAIISETQETHAVHFWDAAQLKILLAHHGFEIVHVSNFPDIGNMNIDNSWTMCVVARKLS